MSKVLFVKANDRPLEQAISVKMYEAFLSAFKESHPSDEIIELDLFQEKLPYYDVDAINGSYKLANGYPLEEAEKTMTDTINPLLDQFLSADKVVFAFPMWNFVPPAVLHTYLDYLSQAGKTFKYTAEGIVGLVPDKKVVLLNARGGVYSEGPSVNMEHAVSYVTTIMGMFGIQDLTPIIIEGHNQYPDRSEQIIQEGLQRVKQTAQQF